MGLMVRTTARGSGYQMLGTMFLILIERTNVVVSALTAFAILYTRSSGVLYFGAGAVACLLSVKLMKRFIRQPRPLNPSPLKRKEDYGMPSTHSAVIAYYAVYSLLACTHLPIHPSLPSSQLTRIIPPMIIVPGAVTIAVSRIWLGHHTWPQVLAGLAHGSIFAPIWLFLWMHAGNKYGEVIENSLGAWE